MSWQEKVTIVTVRGQDIGKKLVVLRVQILLLMAA